MKITTAIIALFIGISWSFGQMPMSKKLGEYDGIPGLNITKEYPKKIDGLFKLPDDEEVWSDFTFPNFTRENVQLADPKKLKYTKFYDLNVERIEVFSYSSETNTHIMSLSVFLKLPKTEKELEKFYDTVIKEYEPMLDMIGYSQNGYDLIQWHSSNECGAMMNMPARVTLERFKELGLTHLEIQYTQSCGG